MAISVDEVTKIISIPKADLTFISGTIYQLDINAFRVELSGWVASEPGGWRSITHIHTAPLTISGVTLARVVEIINGYTITFEDGLYSVNIVGGNSNIADVNNKNQVSVNTANSAGLQDPFSLQAAAFANEVTIDVINGTAGTTFPTGTRGFPSDNLVDAQAIAVARGIPTFRVIGDFTITAGDFSNGFTFTGDSPETTDITLESGANITNCTFRNVTISGVMDGANTIRHCEVEAITMFRGSIHDSGIEGPVAVGPGTTTEIIDSYSELAGGVSGTHPHITLAGVGVSDVVVQRFSGGLGIHGCTDADVAVDVNMVSGFVHIGADMTAGLVDVRGIATVNDESTGTTVVNDDTLTAKVALSLRLAEADQVFDKSAGLLHYYDRGTTTDIIPAKTVAGEAQTVDASIAE